MGHQHCSFLPFLVLHQVWRCESQYTSANIGPTAVSCIHSQCHGTLTPIREGTFWYCRQKSSKTFADFMHLIEFLVRAIQKHFCNLWNGSWLACYCSGLDTLYVSTVHLLFANLWFRNIVGKLNRNLICLVQFLFIFALILWCTQS